MESFVEFLLVCPMYREKHCRCEFSYSIFPFIFFVVCLCHSFFFITRPRKGTIQFVYVNSLPIYTMFFPAPGVSYTFRKKSKQN